jgi:hypothetical protein
MRFIWTEAGYPPCIASHVALSAAFQTHGPCPIQVCCFSFVQNSGKSRPSNAAGRLRPGCVRRRVYARDGRKARILRLCGMLTALVRSRLERMHLSSGCRLRTAVRRETGRRCCQQTKHHKGQSHSMSSPVRVWTVHPHATYSNIYWSI